LHNTLEGASVDLNRAVGVLISGQLYTAVEGTALNDGFTLSFCEQSVATAIQITGITFIMERRLADGHAIFNCNTTIATIDCIGLRGVRATVRAENTALQCQAAASTDINRAIELTARCAAERTGYLTVFRRTAVLDGQASSF